MGVSHPTFFKTHVYIVSASTDRTARLWDVSTGRELVRVDHAGPVLSASLFIRGRPERGEWCLATCSSDGTAKIWRVRARKLPMVAEEAGMEQDRLGVCLSDDLPRGTEVTRVKHDGGELRVVQVSSSGRLLLTGGADGTVRVWNAHSGTIVCSATHPKGVVCADLLEIRGVEILLTGCEDGLARIWNDLNSSAAEIAQLPHDESAIVRCVKFSRTSPGKVILLATGCSQGSARLWKLEGAVPQQLCCVRHDAGSQVLDVQDFLIKRKRCLISCSDDKTVRVWDTEDCRELQRLPLDSTPNACSLAPLGGIPHVLTCCADGSVTLWRWSSLDQTRRSPAGGPQDCLLASPNDSFKMQLSFSHEGSVSAAHLYALNGAW